MTFPIFTQLRLTAVLAIAALLSALQLQAATATYSFQATINKVDGDLGEVILPFGLVAGQQISGTYTFASEQDLLNIFLNPSLGSAGVLTLTIGGVELSASVNAGGNIAYILNPPIPGPYTRLSLGYFSPTDAYPGLPGNIAGQPWSHILTLIGPEGTISDPAQHLDSALWNQLTTLRQLNLLFGFPTSVKVQATVGDFVAVPEPSTIVLTFAALAFFPRHRRRL